MDESLNAAHHELNEFSGGVNNALAYNEAMLTKCARAVPAN